MSHARSLETPDTTDCPACSALGEDPRTGIPCFACAGRGELSARDPGSLADELADLAEWRADMDAADGGWS